MLKKAALYLAFALSCAVAGAQQTVTIPAQTVTAPLVFNGITISLKFTVPAQTVTIPAAKAVTTTAATPALPSGVTFANGVLTVAGSISATSLILTGGTALPTSASGLYLLQLTGGYLQPVPYVPSALITTTAK